MRHRCRNAHIQWTAARGYIVGSVTKEPECLPDAHQLFAQFTDEAGLDSSVSVAAAAEELRAPAAAARCTRETDDLLIGDKEDSLSSLMSERVGLDSIIAPYCAGKQTVEDCTPTGGAVRGRVEASASGLGALLENRLYGVTGYKKR